MKKEFGEIGLQRATSLLQMGLAGTRRPVDELIERLSESDGTGWFRAAIKRGPFGVRVAASIKQSDKGAERVPDLETLIAAKQESKQLLHRAADKDAWLVGLASYLLAIASAAVHHKSVISATPAEELSGSLLDLATVAPEPWSDLLGRAALVVGGERA